MKAGHTMINKMTSKERILATVAGQPVDHIPFSMEVHPSYLLYDPKVANWKDQFERTDYLLSYGVDPMTELWLPDPVFHPDVTVRSWKESNQSDGFTHLVKEYETPAGVLRQVIRETNDLYKWHKINRNTVGPLADPIDGLGLIEDVNPSRSVEFLIKGPEDLEKMTYLFNPPSGQALVQWREDARYAKAQADKTGTTFLARRIYAGSALLWLTDTIASMQTFEEDPDYIAPFLDIVHQWQVQLLDLVLDIGVDMVTRFGYYDGTNFWGRKYFDRYLKPIMDHEADLCHQAGALLSQQQSEGLTHLIEIYKDMKVDILRDVDPVQGYEDMGLLKKELGHEKTIMGGLNCDVWLAGASQNQVNQYIPELFATLAPGGRFILHPIPGVYAEVPWHKVEWVIEAWRKHAGVTYESENTTLQETN